MYNFYQKKNLHGEGQGHYSTIFTRAKNFSVAFEKLTQWMLFLQ